MPNKTNHLKAINASKMRHDNQLLLLNLLQKENMSRSTLAKQMGLTRAAITNLVGELLNDGIIIEVGKENPCSSKKSSLLSLSTNHYYAAGLVLNRELCQIGIMDFKGHIVKEKKLQISNQETAAESSLKISSELRALVSDNQIGATKIIGLGISTPGPVDKLNGQILNPRDFYKWHYYNIVNDLKSQSGWNCFLEQQSVARTTYEKYFGIGHIYKNFLLLEVTEGIGCGIVLNNKIYSGKGGFGSEIGHMSIKIDGIKCSCGNTGCLTQYASIPAILKKSKQPFRSWKELIDAAYTGDSEAGKLLKLEAKYLAAAIISAVNLLEPEVVVLAGDVIYKPEMLLSHINEFTRTALLMRNQQTISTICTNIEENQNILSACTIAIENFFSAL